MYFGREELKLSRSEPRSWPSKWRPQTTCSEWPTWPESWCACASAAWATATLTRPSSWASSCGRSTTASPTSGTRARTRCPRSCTLCDRAWGRWRTLATPCESAAQRSPSTCWPTCSPVGPHSWTRRKEWFNPLWPPQCCFCSLWCNSLLQLCSTVIVCTYFNCICYCLFLVVVPQSCWGLRADHVALCKALRDKCLCKWALQITLDQRIEMFCEMPVNFDFVITVKTGLQ